MTTQDIRRLRRPLKPEKNNIVTVYGRYVNSRKEVISDFQEDLLTLTESENQQYMDLLKKSLDGHLGKSLYNLHVDPEDAVSRRLAELSAQEMPDDFDTKLKSLFDDLIRRINFDGTNFVLLAARNSYDIHKYTPSGRKCKGILDTLHYIILLACPVQQGDEELGYEDNDSRFHSKILNQVIFSPYLAVTYPALHDAAVRRDMAIAYAHKKGVPSLQSFLNGTVGSRKKSVHTHQEQKRVISDAITTAIGKDCTVNSYLDLQKNLAKKIAEFEDDSGEAKQFKLDELTEFMSDAGFSDSALDIFQEEAEAQFGSPDVEIPGSLVCDQSWTRINVPDFKITCRPEATDRIRTEERDGKAYLVIRVEDSNVEVNGIKIPL